MRISDWSSDVCSSDLPSGYIVTNHHVIADADEVEVVLSVGTSLDATIVGSDKDTDLALLQVQAKKPLPSTALGDSDAPRIGEWLFPIGNPFCLGGTVTAGIAPSRSRQNGRAHSRATVCHIVSFLVVPLLIF